MNQDNYYKSIWSVKLLRIHYSPHFLSPLNLMVWTQELAEIIHFGINGTTGCITCMDTLALLQWESFIHSTGMHLVNLKC